MPLLNLTPEELLTTTRAVRKRLDMTKPVDPALIRECMEIAMQAPTGSNEQHWHFVVVMAPERRKALAALYKKAWEMYRNSPAFSAYSAHADDPNMTAVQDRMVSSVDYLANNLAQVPVHVIPCITGRVEEAAPPFQVVSQASAYGSIVPATWSFMLAARAHGLGTTWTTLHLFFEKEAAEILDIPFAEVTQIALIPLAHTIGTEFKPGPRRSLDRVLHIDQW